MAKYNIENNIDFYNELYNSLDIDDTKIEDDTDNKCLISYEILQDKYITLECKHKFNYIPLYKDILNHKYKFNSMENKIGHLELDEIRCPYCRKKQKGVLPYYEEFNLEKKNGVNYYDPSEIKTKIKITKHLNKCEYLIENKNYDENKNDYIEIGNSKLLNCKYYKCKNIGTKIENPLISDNKYYCYIHKKMIVKNKKEEIKKLQNKEKLKIKEETKNFKLQLKQEEKEIKQKIKEEEKKLKLILSDECNTEIKNIKVEYKEREKEIKKLYKIINNDKLLKNELDDLKNKLDEKINILKYNYKLKFDEEIENMKVNIKDEFYSLKKEKEEKKDDINIILGPIIIN